MCGSASLSSCVWRTSSHSSFNHKGRNLLCALFVDSGGSYSLRHFDVLQLELNAQVHAHLLGEAEERLHLLTTSIGIHARAACDCSRRWHIDVGQLKAIGHDFCAAEFFIQLIDLRRDD